MNTKCFFSQDILIKRRVNLSLKRSNKPRMTNYLKIQSQQLQLQVKIRKGYQIRRLQLHNRKPEIIHNLSNNQLSQSLKRLVKLLKILALKQSHQARQAVTLEGQEGCKIRVESQRILKEAPQNKGAEVELKRVNKKRIKKSKLKEK